MNVYIYEKNTNKTLDIRQHGRKRHVSARYHEEASRHTDRGPVLWT